MKNVEIWVKYMRQAVYDFPGCVECLRQVLAEKGMKLEDVGTSEAEISMLRRQYYIYTAKKWLEKVRKDKYWLFNLKEVVAEGNLTLDQIGTTPAEIASFAS